MHVRLAFVICLLVVLFPIVGHAEVWNLADDFSATQNPHGAWSYGWRATPDQAVSLYTDTTPDYWCPTAGVESWRQIIEDECPYVSHNPHDYAVICPGYCEASAHSVWFHPGPAQQSVVRWSSPRHAQVQLVTHFYRPSPCLASDSDRNLGRDIVHVYRNDVELFSAELDNWGQSADYATALTVESGDVIDCAVSPLDFHGSWAFLDVVLTAEEPVPAAEETWGRVKAIFR